MKNLNLVLLAILFSVFSINLLANKEQKPNILINPQTDYQPEFAQEPELIEILCVPEPECKYSIKSLIQSQSVQPEPAPATE